MNIEKQLMSNYKDRVTLMMDHDRAGVFADYLEEQGWGDEAEQIRAQVLLGGIFWGRVPTERVYHAQLIGVDREDAKANFAICNKFIGARRFREGIPLDEAHRCKHCYKILKDQALMREAEEVSNES